MALPNRLGRYRLLRRLARGGMGEVHLGVLEATGNVRRHAAIKVLIEASPKAQTALLAEARLAALLSHPNVVQLLDAGVDDGHAWFAMEYVAGLSLAELFEAGRERIPPWVSARIVADACAALHAVHEATDENGRPLSIVHRDVTPHNLLVSSSGFVKLVDFGIARSAFQHSLTTTGVVRGKLGYLSPEQIAGAPVDRRSDIFSLGILLWELLTGERLFKQATEAETIAAMLRGDIRRASELAPDVPPSLQRVAERALLKDPASRYGTALEMQRALEAAIQASGSSVGAHEVAQLLATLTSDRPASPEPADETMQPQAMPSAAARTPVRRLRWRNASLLAGAVLLGAALAAMALAFSRAERPAPKEVSKPVAIEHTTPSPPAAVSLPEPQLEAAPTPLASPDSALARLPSALLQPNPKPPATRRSHASATSNPAPVGSSPARGRINVSARGKWAMIRVDGKPVGSTPLSVPDLKPGLHQVEALPLGQEPALKKMVNVESEQTLRVDFAFD